MEERVGERKRGAGGGEERVEERSWWWQGGNRNLWGLNTVNDVFTVCVRQRERERER